MASLNSSASSGYSAAYARMRAFQASCASRGAGDTGGKAGLRFGAHMERLRGIEAEPRLHERDLIGAEGAAVASRLALLVWRPVADRGAHDDEGGPGGLGLGLADRAVDGLDVRIALFDAQHLPAEGIEAAGDIFGERERTWGHRARCRWSRRGRSACPGRDDLRAMRLRTRCLPSCRRRRAGRRCNGRRRCGRVC